jgi:hypothetical protein
MPTPFTHLAFAQRVLVDTALPAAMRDSLHSERGAFLLGSIAADARVSSGMDREQTHFYAYDKPIKDHPWRVMVQRNPALLLPQDAAHRAFVAAYVAHLSVDEFWSLNMVGPQFAMREWASRVHRFLFLQIILTYMDERDYAVLQPWQHDQIAAAAPDDWLPFMSDDVLREWRDFVDAQIAPGGVSQTVAILAERIKRTPDDLRAILDSPAEMQHGLWDYIPQTFLADVESRMYDFAREQMLIYWDESKIGLWDKG